MKTHDTTYRWQHGIQSAHTTVVIEREQSKKPILYSAGVEHVENSMSASRASASSEGHKCYTSASVDVVVRHV